MKSFLRDEEVWRFHLTSKVPNDINVRAMTALSLRLRLSPQARQPRNLNRRPAPLSHYERIELDDDER